MVAKNSSSLAISGSSGGATIGTVGESRASKPSQRARHAGDPVAARVRAARCSRPRVMRLAAADAQRDARVVAAPRSASSVRCQAQLSAAAKPPARSIAASSVERGSAMLSMRAPASRSRVRLRSKARATVRVEAVEHQRARHARSAGAERPAGAARRGAREDFVQQHRVAHRARDRAGGVERGRQRHRAVESASARAVFLKPTRPCSAAGMRIEPPVSEPSAAQAAPVATETAPPDVEPPGMRGCRVERGGGRVGRRAVVRVDADAGERELGHVGVADQRRAGARAGARRRLRRAPPGAAPASTREPARGRRAAHVEQRP